MALSFTTISGNGRHSLPSTNSGFNSEIDEEEVDQLDSGLDDETDGMEPEIEEEESISTAKGRRKLGVRQPGHTLVPQDRLDNILQAEGSGPHMSKEAIYMLSVATEEFVKTFAEAGYQQTTSENRQHVQYRDMATVTHRQSKYKFLQDTIPKPISIVEAMQLRAAKERELLEDDPAISAMAPSSPTFPPVQSSISVSTNAQAKANTRPSLPVHVNGAETNGTLSASVSASASAAGTPVESESASTARSQRQRDRRGRWRNGPSTNGSHEGTPPASAATTETRAGSARVRNRSTRAREAAEAARPHTNGTPSARNGRSASHVSAHNGSESASTPQSGASEQVVGPASGFLGDGDKPLSNAMTDNPGRTIYSHQRTSA